MFIDMDVASMYAWSPLVVKQSSICKILKQRRSGKSHRAKILAKRRLKLYRGAWVEYDTDQNKDWSKKHISIMEMHPKSDFDEAIKFLFEQLSNTPEKGLKKCLNATFGSLT